MNQSSKNKIIKSFDTYFSKCVRARDGRCLRCGKAHDLQCAHVYSRKNFSIRWDMDNAVTLCSSCHLYWAHKEPNEFKEWLKTFVNVDFLEVKMRMPFKKSEIAIKTAYQLFKEKHPLKV